MAVINYFHNFDEKLILHTGINILIPLECSSPTVAVINYFHNSDEKLILHTGINILIPLEALVLEKSSYFESVTDPDPYRPKKINMKM